MNFCVNCGNMYYMRLRTKDAGTSQEGEGAATAEPLDELAYYCRNCGHVDDTLTVGNICVLETKTKKGASFSHAINRYTKLDPTLPHISTIKCPNAQCESNEDASKRDVIYLRYDDVAMKYVYICSTCDAIWTTDDE